MPTTIPSATPGVNDGTLIDLVSSDPELSELNRLVERAGFDTALGGPGPFTLFAGTNDAYNAIPPQFLTILFENDEFLPHVRDLLLYNILNGEFRESNFTSEPVPTLNGETVQPSQNPFAINGVAVSGIDIEASNGVLQKTDDVLTSSWVPRTLGQRLREAPELSITNELFVLSGIGLEDVGLNLTLLAPTDGAWNTLDATVLEALRNPDNIEFLQTVLLYHILQGVFVSPELFPRRIDTFEGGFVTIATNPLRVNNNAAFLTVDLLANNGVLHRINRVLDFGDGVGGDTVLDFIATNEDLSIFFGAVQRAGFVPPLQAPSTLTVFAATNAAFLALPQEFLDLLFTNNEFIVHLQNLLLYGLLPEKRFEADFANEEIFETLNGENLQSLTNPFRINTLPIEMADNNATNGVTHVIGGLLAPSWVFNTVGTRVANDPELSITDEFLAIAEISLNIPGAFTFLAPTNTAWNKFSFVDLNALRNNPALLTEILAYHIALPIFTASEFSVGLELPTPSGEVVTITSIDAAAGIVGLNEFATSLSPSTISVFDILGANGVLHKVDTVLDPADSML